MNKIFRNAQVILKNNLIFIQPLLLYMLLAMFIVSSLALSNAGIQVKLLLFLSLILMFTAFLAGWISINMSAVDDYSPDDDLETINQKTLKNLKLFFSFVGENFSRSLLGIIVYALFYMLVSFSVIFLTMKYVNEPTSIIDMFRSIDDSSYTTSQIMEMQKTAMRGVAPIWLVLMTVCPVLFNFLGILYFVVLFKTKKNCLISLFETLKFFFKNFLNSLYLMFILFLIYFVIGAVTMFVGSGSLASILFIIMFAIYLNYYLILVFCFYNEKTKNNSNSGTELVG